MHYKAMPCSINSRDREPFLADYITVNLINGHHLDERRGEVTVCTSSQASDDPHLPVEFLNTLTGCAN